MKEEVVVVGWQGSEFLWFLLPNGTLVAGPSTTQPPSPMKPCSFNLLAGFKQCCHIEHGTDLVLLVWIQDHWTEPKLRRVPGGIQGLFNSRLVPSEMEKKLSEDPFDLLF